MSKELAFTDDNDVVKYLDTTTAFNLALTADGVAFDLTNAKSVLVKIANDDGYIMQQTIDLTTVTSPLGGTLSFPINQDIMNTLVPDDYDIEVWVTMNDGTQAIFPSDGTLGFSIEENLMSDTGEVIPTITLNDFQQQFNDLSSQMENAVQNVHKGDQGNPGNGIKSANNQYQLSDSPVTVPTGGWSDTILATTDQLPYLWTKIIFIYDDGTTKETNFVSSRGDTGSQGPMGPVGPQGKQGNGLVVRGKADKEENLPTTGNNQGDGYLVGTDLYIWIDGSWQNMGSITPDLADYVKVADMNNALNAKQDKIGYTPADDSEVVHDNHDNTITANSSIYDLSKSGLTPLQYVNSGSFNDLPLGTVFADATKMTDGPDTIHSFTTTTFFFSDWNGRKAQIAIADNTNLMYFRVYTGTGWASWTLLSDDSQVAHLSGANNFDTVPTVKNNPLLLASSLPSDLARTGSNQEFTGKNTFDTAPIDKKTGNPYITAKAPGIPKLEVTYNATSKAFDYTLTAPEKDGLSDIIQYNLLWKDHSVDDWTTVIVKPDALTGQLTGVDITKTYDFKVAAQNAVGFSEFTDVITLPALDDNIYGVSWDGSSSGALQRTDAAVGLKAGINGAQNDFDTRGPWGLMDKTVTDSYGNAFVRVPKFYIRKTQDKSKPLSTWQVSLVKQGDDWYLPNCFYDFDNNKELDYVDVSRYEGSIISGKLQSQTGVTPTNVTDINDFRTAATALNVNGKKGYHLWDVHTLDALQVLFTIEFATLDSQSIMKGVTDNVLAAAEATGAADGVKGSSGNVDHSNGYGSMTYRGIENLYGNLAMCTDGLNISNLSLYSCDDATKYISDTFTNPYYKVSYPLIFSGGQNITGLGFDKEHPGVTAPTSFNSDSYNTYYHDDGNVNTPGNYSVYTGGSWDWGAGVSGLWGWSGLHSSAGAYTDLGSRLLKKAL